MVINTTVDLETFETSMGQDTTTYSGRIWSMAVGADVFFIEGFGLMVDCFVLITSLDGRWCFIY